MCTAAIVRTKRPAGYFMVFNRDELTRRGLATPPRITRTPHGVRAVAPTDPDGGGTWIAASEHGEVFSLLNNYHDGHGHTPTEPIISRGAVVRWMVERPPHADLRQLFSNRRAVLEQIRPFHLIAIAAAGAANVWTWTGQRLESTELSVPTLLVSAGQHQPIVDRARRARLDAGLRGDVGWGAIAAALSAHQDTRGPGETCLHLSQVATVSQTVVAVSPTHVTMHYKAGSPCSTHEWHSTLLVRPPNPSVP